GVALHHHSGSSGTSLQQVIGHHAPHYVDFDFFGRTGYNCLHELETGRNHLTFDWLPSTEQSAARMAKSLTAVKRACRTSLNQKIIYNAAEGNLLQEVRRGADRAEIYSLAFSNNLQYLAVSSDKGTIHVFNLKINVGSTANDKPIPAPDPEVSHISPPLSFIKGVLPKYFHSEWSVAQFRLHEGEQYIVAFGHEKNTVSVVGMDG
ncbi:hypothetical protein ACJX0J_035585, partial [Zea mays]